MILYLIHFRLRIMCCFGGIKGWPPFQLFNEIERLSLLSFIHSFILQANCFHVRDTRQKRVLCFNCITFECIFSRQSLC